MREHEGSFFDPRANDGADVDAVARHVPRRLRTELACARALLDALETLFAVEREDLARLDVVVQLADQLARLASTIKQREGVPPCEPARGTGEDHL
jgi:hypothetical protein